MTQDLLTVEQLPDGSGLRLVGEVDLSNAETLEQELASACRNGGSVILDCSALTFMDSSGFRALLRSAGRVRQGGKLIIDSPPQMMLWSIEALGLDKLPQIEVRTDGSADGFRPGFGPGAANRFELACLAFQRNRRATVSTLAHTVAALSCNRDLRAELRRLLAGRAA